ncbi:MAG: Mut7-C RNAse domain-containing protein [Deltaproteobacteria bacterium]|nr:Mut7-C RNAse domain-containing protein [Deltaproteobacteria bacterium]
MDGFESNEKSFLADRMVGRLGRWLRMMGVDCASAEGLLAPEVLDKALAERRVLVTRDTGLMKRRTRVERFFIRSNFVQEQVLEFLGAYPIDPLERAFTRCVECNEPLERVEKESLSDEVPVYVRRTQDVFSRCPACKRVYWAATHRRRMETRLRSLGQKTLEKREGTNADDLV